MFIKYDYLIKNTMVYTSTCCICKNNDKIKLRILIEP